LAQLAGIFSANPAIEYNRKLLKTDMTPKPKSSQIVFDEHPSFY